MSLRAVLQTLLGLVLAATPLVLWIAWSPAMLAGVIVVALLSAGLLLLVTESTPEARAAERTDRLPDEFFEEVQHLHPMVYHHSGRRSSRFHRSMRRLKQLTGLAQN